MVQNTEIQPKLRQTKTNDEFWNYYQNLILTQVIPYQEKVLLDEIPGVEESHAIENFRIAAGRSQGEFYGMVFQDSDVAKWLEAVSNAIAISDDPRFRSKADEMIELIGSAQEPDGYLDTYFQIKAPDRKWTDLEEAHELYCMGHMIEASVAHFESTNEDSFLKIGCRIADCIDARFGKSKARGIPGHPEIELALMRLYHATGEKRYLKLAEYFIDERGTQPNYFKEETERRNFSISGMNPLDTEYAQNNRPVRELSEAVGHAVRAVYLYTAMADLAADIHDEKLYEACERLWDDIVKRKMYITGGIGSTVHGEAFTIPYDLPNDTVYAETCASVGVVFFAREMLQIKPDRKYADVMERELYNGVLSGMQHDGKRFFYVNPLEVDPEISGKLYGYEHVLPERPQWYACACCPTNVARCITALSKYAWGENENTIYSHLYLGGTFHSQIMKNVAVTVESEYPWKGKIHYTISGNRSDRKFTLAIRIPAWAEHVELTRNEKKADPEMKDGYALFREMDLGDQIQVTFDMPVRKIYASTRVRKDAGLAAVMRGPIVYAAEEADNGKQLYDLAFSDAEFETEMVHDPVIGSYVQVRTMGRRYTSKEDTLYTPVRPESIDQKLILIPYFLWGNRGLGEMRVFIRDY